jgi:phosphatidylglycerophosphatase A
MPLLGVALMVVIIVVAIQIADRGATALQQKDPQAVVIDEIAGFMIANFLVPSQIVPLIVSFALFRFFDIAKIYPAGPLEKLAGGRGIVLDDVMAGVYTLVIVQALLHWEIL